MPSFRGRDILSLRDFEREDYLRVFQVCDELAPIARDRRSTGLLSHKILAVAFYQASTRTRLSMESAMHRLGGRVLGFSDPAMTRAGDSYQESLADTVRMLECYGDVIAMRHYREGAPAEAAGYSAVPVINCGDGWGEHPTQVLADLYTVYKKFGRLDGLHVLCISDMRLRTIHSLIHALSRFSIEATFVGPPRSRLSEEARAGMTTRGVRFREADTVTEAIADADVIYMDSITPPDYTCSQTAAGEARPTPPEFRLTRDLLDKRARRDAIVLHSLPRMDELPPEIDGTPQACYWEEAFNNVVMRMALLALVLGAVDG